MRVNNEDLMIVDGVAVAPGLSTSKNMKPLWLGHVVNYGIQIVMTGTPAGTWKLQVSNDKGYPNAQGDAEKYITVTNWTDVQDSTFVVAAAGNVFWEVENSGSEWVRAVWIATGAGTAPLIASARAKVKGL